jgi:hypothetical protein
MQSHARESHHGVGVPTARVVQLFEVPLALLEAHELDEGDVPWDAARGEVGGQGCGVAVVVVVVVVVPGWGASVLVVSPPPLAGLVATPAAGQQPRRQKGQRLPGKA